MDWIENENTFLSEITITSSKDAVRSRNSTVFRLYWHKNAMRRRRLYSSVLGERERKITGGSCGAGGTSALDPNSLQPAKLPL